MGSEQSEATVLTRDISILVFSRAAFSDQADRVAKRIVINSG
jgi:hypothetical protein